MAIESRFLKGKKVFSDWEIKEYIGSGSGGKTAVFRIVRQHEGWEETAALKVINVMEEIGTKEDLEESYRQAYEAECEELSGQAKEELRLMSFLQGNPNIVEYYDFAFVEYQSSNVFGMDLLIRMELLENLREEQKRKGCYSEKEVIRIGRDICKGLKYCHKLGIIHRDIKPANIFVTPWGTYKLGDFGIARMLEAGQKASTRMGTRAYAAPEQFMSSDGKYDEKVDIYSLGLTMYELANSNRLPFATSAYVRESEIQMRIMGKEFPDPCNAGPFLAGVIQKACKKEAEQRYSSVEEFESALVAAEIGLLTGDTEPEAEEEELPDNTADKHTGTVQKLKIWLPVLVALEAILITVLLIKLLDRTPQTPQTDSAPVVSEVTEPVKSEGKEPVVLEPSESVMEQEFIAEQEIVTEGLTMDEVLASIGKVKYTTATNTHAALITESGDLFMWGENESAQIGCGNREYQPVPVRVLGDVESVYLSEFHTAALKTNGDLYLWGDDRNLEIGNGNGEYQLYPAKILSDVKEVALGNQQSGALCNNGDLYGWGDYIGNGIGVYCDTPTLIASGVKTFYMDYFEGGAITDSGKLLMWGENRHGQVGKGPSRGTPVKMAEGMRELRIGYGTVAAISEEGDLYMWGDTTYGQVGNRYYNTYVDEPQCIMKGVKSVYPHMEHTAAITEEGVLYMWGRNNNGQLGILEEEIVNNEVMFLTPQPITNNVSQAVLGERTTAIIKENGDLYMCGNNSCGQITDDDIWRIDEFTKIAENITSVGVSWDATYAVDTEGNFHYWGNK